MRTIFLCLLSLFIAADSVAQEIDLKLNLAKGNTYYHNITGNTVITQTIDGKEVIVDVTLGGRTSFAITGIKDSIYLANVMYNTLVMKMNMQGQTYAFSSDTLINRDKMSMILAHLVNKPFAVEMKTSGKLIKVQNIDTILANLIDQFPALGAAQKQQILQQLLGSFGEKAFAGSFNMITSMFPSTKVSKNDKWEVTTNLESGMSATLKTVYQLTGISDHYYEIRGEGQLLTADKDAYKTINGMPARYSLAGPMTSNFTISKLTGWITEGKIAQSMSGSVEIKDNAQIPGGMIIPMTYVADIKVSGN